MQNANRVHILLATYDGSKYLTEQLRSIESQTLPVTRVSIRDDGSTDSTASIVERWSAGRPNIRVAAGVRLGATANFLTLLKDCEGDCDYYAFCDQDDVWVPRKMERALFLLRTHENERPLLYCSRVEFVDEELVHLGYSRIPSLIGFANALVENIATGCSVVLNAAARDLICSRLPGRDALLHDWWSYLTVSAFGKVVYDETPGVKYRQHAGNHEGGTASSRNLFKRRISRFLRRTGSERLLSNQALEFRRCFGDLLGSNERGILEHFLSVRSDLWARVSYNFGMEVRRQTCVDTAFLRAMILLGRV